MRVIIISIIQIIHLSNVFHASHRVKLVPHRLYAYRVLLGII